VSTAARKLVNLIDGPARARAPVNYSTGQGRTCGTAHAVTRPRGKKSRSRQAARDAFSFSARRLRSPTPTGVARGALTPALAARVPRADPARRARPRRALASHPMDLIGYVTPSGARRTARGRPARARARRRSHKLGDFLRAKASLYIPASGRGF